MFNLKVLILIAQKCFWLIYKIHFWVISVFTLFEKQLEKYCYIMFEGKESARSSRVQSYVLQHVFQIKFILFSICLLGVDQTFVTDMFGSLLMNSYMVH